MKTFILVVAIITNSQAGPSQSDLDLQLFNSYERCAIARDTIVRLNDVMEDRSRQQIYAYCIEQ